METFKTYLTAEEIIREVENIRASTTLCHFQIKDGLSQAYEVFKILQKERQMDLFISANVLNGGPGALEAIAMQLGKTGPETGITVVEMQSEILSELREITAALEVLRNK
jgi:hypothetical protein